MGSSTIESSAKYLGNLLVEEVQYLAAVKDKVEDLQSELEWMQCFLWDVDVKQDKNALLRKWVSEIKDLALDAENLIETYILKVSHKRQNKGLLDDLKWFSCCLRDAKTLHEVGSNIDVLSAKISKLSSRLQMYGVKTSYSQHSYDVVMDKKLIAEQRRTYADVYDENIVGLEESVAQLVQTLQSDSQHKIVVVHGMGGIGKTTLAREVFKGLKNRTLKSKFEGFAWAYVSQQLQFESVCKDILLQLIPEKERASFRKLGDSELRRKIIDTLKQKICVVVLDDVWSKNDWERLERVFPFSDTSFGSKLLITTRDPQVIPDRANDFVSRYQVDCLDDDKSWQLLQNTAHFKKENSDHTLLELVKKMLDHCNGHPLAIAVLGGVLATKNVEEWQSVYDNLPSHLQGDDSYTGVYQVLAMSYYELPYRLKPCFLLLGHFPEDFDIPVERLYHIWIAEGIISSTLGRSVTKRVCQSLEEICQVYLNELVQKGMVQVGSRNMINETIESCRLHDLMRDKCLVINEEENFLQIINYHARENDPQRTLNVPDEKLRRMTIYGDDIIPSPIPKSASGNSPPLRSFLFVALKDGEEFEDCGCIVALCKDFQLLRVLDIEGLLLTGSLPKEVGSLRFLRYLSLKDTWICELPSSIENLRSLLILDLRVCCDEVIMRIPNVLWKMKSLRHLYFPVRYQIKEDKMLKLEQLSHLEKLENVDLDKVEGLVELGSMRKMTTRCESNKRGLEPILKSKSITWLHLRIHANIFREDPVVLSTCDSLKALDIFDETPSLSSVPLPVFREMFPQNLMFLHISRCKLSEDPMPILETLSKLKILILVECDNVNELLCSEKAFPELTHLCMHFLSSLKYWTVENGGLPKLREVIIDDSPIIMLPDVLPTNVSITCRPCVTGIERYGTCPHFKGVFQDDEEEANLCCVDDEEEEDDDGDEVLSDDIEDADDTTKAPLFFRIFSTLKRVGKLIKCR